MQVTKEIINEVKSINKAVIEEYARNREQALIKYIKLDLTAVPDSTITCLVCKVSAKVPNSDNFIEHSVWVSDDKGKHHSKLIKSNKELVKHFQTTHWKQCIKFLVDKKKGA